MGQKLIDLFKGEITGSESEESGGGKSAKSSKGDYGSKGFSKVEVVTRQQARLQIENL